VNSISVAFRNRLGDHFNTRTMLFLRVHHARAHVGNRQWGHLKSHTERPSSRPSSSFVTVAATPILSSTILAHGTTS
jgi:hypothetical protein